jgi:hypothetical protein
MHYYLYGYYKRFQVWVGMLLAIVCFYFIKTFTLVLHKSR